MKCDDCKYAQWLKTSSGRNHPSKGGKCTYEIVILDLPAAFYWIGGKPSPAGGYIERGREMNKNCPTFVRDIT